MDKLFHAIRTAYSITIFILLIAIAGYFAIDYGRKQAGPVAFKAGFQQGHAVGIYECRTIPRPRERT